MIFWLDAHVPPAMGSWLEARFDVSVRAVRDLGLQSVKDEDLFFAARSMGADVFVTKDEDFLYLLWRYSTPPQVLWLTGGNTSTQRLQEVFAIQFAAALELLLDGEPLVEISCSRTSPS